MGARIIGGALPSVTYHSNSVINATSNTFTFASQSIGTEGSRRYVVVAVMNIGSTVTGVTIGGITATNVTGSAFDPTFYMALVPTGTTATVVVTQSASVASTVSITVWSVRNIRSATAVATSTSTASPANLDLNASSNGVVIALAYSGSNGATYSWTGLTEDYEQTSGINNVPRSGSHIDRASAETPRTVRCTYSASASPRAAAISLR